MAFAFVDDRRIDETSRKLIRSHVMQGKNAGRSRPRVRRKRSEERREAQPYRSILPISKTNDNEQQSRALTMRSKQHSSSPSPSPYPGDPLHYFTFPCVMSPQLGGMIYHFMYLNSERIFPIQWCTNIAAFKSLWFQFLQSSEAFFHVCVALGEAEVDLERGSTSTSPRALMHLSKAYHCITQSLAAGSSPSDATLATVVSLSIHDDLRQQFGTTKVHFDALCRMVELRGGLGNLLHSPYLVQKICRIDIWYSLQQGAPPFFWRDEYPCMLIEDLLVHLDIARPKWSLHPMAAQLKRSRLRPLAADVETICLVLNSDLQSFRLEADVFTDIVISLAYRLLRLYNVPHERPEDDTEATLYYGLLAVVCTLVLHRMYLDVLEFDWIKELLKTFIDSQLAAKSADRQGLLWLIFITGITYFREGDYPWLLPRINECKTALHPNDWEGAKEIIKKYPWIDAIHDQAGRDLWHAAMTCNKVKKQVTISE